ncbi:MAG: hypothetical protein JSV99_04770 [Planctomycetota bacterium]|nr:MAG: hypothetical protein JSV99_04770 [Planctomycetota bacterium]
MKNCFILHSYPCQIKEKLSNIGKKREGITYGYGCYALVELAKTGLDGLKKPLEHANRVLIPPFCFLAAA